MRICWLNDYKLDEFQGGANITNSIMIKKGKELGHEIIEVTPDKLDFLTRTKSWGFDLIILNNINAFKKEIIEWVIGNTTYIKYEHDYSFCQFRSAQCSRCKIKCTPAQIFINMFSNSILNIFLSPLHLDTHKKFFKETMRDAIFIPSPLEKDKFYPDTKIQKDAYLFAGALMTHKGVTQILDYADTQKDKVFHFAGKAVNKKILDRIKKKHTYLGEIPYKDIPLLMRKYKHFIVNPLWNEPFGRNVIEAMVSGCSIIKFAQSNQTGLESYKLSPALMIDHCITAPLRFWNEVKKVMKNV